MLDEARANSFYDMLVRTDRMKEGNRQETIRRIQDPGRGKEFYDFLVKEKGFKEENREETMRRLYPGLHGVLPYADRRERGFESPVSMEKLPGLIRERKEREQAKEAEARKGFQDWLRERDRKIGKARASLPGIRAENDALYSAFSSLEQERAGRAVPGQGGDAPDNTLDSYGRMDAMNGLRMSDIQENLAYIDALEGQLDKLASIQQARMPVPVGQEVKDRLVPEVRFDAVRQEELAPDMDRLSKEIGRVKSQTRALQREYVEQQMSDLDLLLGAAALKVGGTFTSEDKGREAMAEAMAATMSMEEASEIFAGQAVIRDAQRNLRRMYKAASVDPEGSGWSRFWQGVSAAFDGGRGLLTLGLSDVSEGIRALQALKRVEAGEGSAADKALVESLADRANAESLMDGGHAYGIGQSLYGSLEFILDMAVTGGLAAWLRKGAAKVAAKLVGRKVTDAAGKAASTRLGKAAVKGTDMALASAISPMTMQGTAERQQQNYLYGRDDEGRLVVRGVSMPESWFKSYANAFGSNLVSRFVEQSVGPFAERNLFGRFFKALNRTTQKFTPSYIRKMRNLGKELGEQVRRAANVQGFAGENFEEFLDQPLQYWLVAQTGREKELGKEKAWSDVYGEGFLLETLGTVALMQALFSLPSAAVGTRSMIDNHALMRKHLSALDEGTAKKLRGVMALEDDNARAQGLAGLLRSAGSMQAREDILGYAVSRAASNMGLSWRRAEAQGLETEAYRQTLMAASSDGKTVTTAKDKDGNTFAVRAVDGDRYALAYPVADNGDGTVSLGAPVQRSLSDFDKGSMEAVPLETYLRGLSSRQRAQGQAEDAAAREADRAAAQPEIRKGIPMQADRPFVYFNGNGKTEAGVAGSTVHAVEDLPAGTAPGAMVQVVVAKPGGSSARNGFMAYGDLQALLADGTLEQAVEPVVPEPAVEAAGQAVTAPEGETEPAAPVQEEGMEAMERIYEEQREEDGGMFGEGRSDKKETVARTEPQQPNNAISTGSSLSGNGTDVTTAPEPNGEPTVSVGKVTQNSGTEPFVGRSLTEEEAGALIARMEADAEAAPELELTPENWVAEFGEDGMVETPIGEVKMGENQLAKMFLKKRAKEFGMVKPTLTDPDVVLEKPAPEKGAERESKYLFVKTFVKPDGSRYVHYESVTVKKDGLEVSISSHEAEREDIKKEMQNDVVLHLNRKSPSGSDESLTETPVREESDLVPSFGESGNKITKNSGTEPTEAQKKAGNYKKEHVRIDGYNITIENPKGSVRSGVDGNGTPWSVTMNNAYGYIRGTEGLDGDHIDVFLSETPEQGRVFVIDQVDPETGRFDEHKVMYGFGSAEEARDAYLSNYSPGWKGLGSITEVGKDEFRKWIDSSRRKTKPFSEYKSVKTEGGQGEGKGTIPLDDSGNPVYEQAPVEATWADLLAQNEGDEKEALVTAQAMIDNKEAELEAARKELEKKPKGKTVAEIQRSKAERKRKEEEALSGLDYWRKVAAWPEEKRKAEEHARKMNERNKRSLAAKNNPSMPFSKRNAALGEANTFRELFLRMLATGEVQIKESALMELGMTKSDVRGLMTPPPLVSERYGKTLDNLVQDMWDMVTDGTVGPYMDAVDIDAVRSVIQESIGSVESRRDAMEQAERLHYMGMTEEEYRNRESGDGMEEAAGGPQETGEERLAAPSEPDAETKAWIEEMGLDYTGEPPFHRSGEEGTEAPTAEEAALRDALSAKLREAGIEVVEDSEAGQRVLDEANGKNVMLNARKKKSLETDSVPQEEHQRTVISSDDGAKVLNNLDDLIKEYENSVHTKEKTFIGNAAKALGAKRYGSKSEYATFETVNGNEVTIRLSDHNASVERMDKAGRDNAISIVVTPKPNSGILDDGNAHIVEFYYNAIRLRRAEGKPLVEILKSIKQALYSGEFKDTTGLAEVKVVNADRIRYHRGYHGSGADFESFDHSHMGEGEGAQAYGWGSYVTEVEGIGRTYAEASAGEGYVYKGGDSHKELAAEIITTAHLNGETPGQVINSLKEFAREDNDTERLSELEGIKESDFERPVRHLYTVEIPDDTGKNYLAWDKELSEEETRWIVEALSEVEDPDFNYDYFTDKLEQYQEQYNLTGEGLYKLLTRFGFNRNDRKASEALSRMGYTGISYPAQYLSGGRSDGARNYVIFKESDLKITDHVRFFRTPGGEAYGYTVDGKIYLDPRIATSETPVHEYAHLWAEALRKANPEEWRNIVGLMKDSPVWEEVKERYPELRTEDEIADEVLATYSGRRGAERLREARRKHPGKDFGEALGAIEAMNRVREALQRFWSAVADFLHINYRNAEEVADRVMRDLLEGVNPMKSAEANDGSFSEKDEDIRFRSSGESGSATGREAKERAARQLGVRLGVEVVFEDASKMSGRKRGAKGWFDPKSWTEDGRRVIHVVLDNHADAADVERTILHEAVGHLGLREVLGPDLFDPFLDEAWGMMPEKVRETMLREAGKGRDGQGTRRLRRIAAEEWMASMAEVGGDPTVWERLVSAVRRLLRKAGVRLRLSEADIKALLYESRMNLERSRFGAERELMESRQRLYREAAFLERELREEEAGLELGFYSDSLLYRKWYGGNSGYVGYSMSRRAAEAREEGRFPKTDFKKEYHVSEHALKALVRTGFIDGSEWHHTSKYGNRTPFYGWTDEASAQTYLDNKKEVDALSKEYDGLGMASPDDNAGLFLEERMSSMRKERGYGMDFLTDGEKAERSRRLDEIGIADFGMDEAERARINAASEAVIDEYRELSGRRIREMESEIQGMDEYKNRVEEEGRKEARRKEIEGRLEEIFGRRESVEDDGLLYRRGDMQVGSVTLSRKQQRAIRRRSSDERILTEDVDKEGWSREQNFRKAAVDFGRWMLDEDLPVKTFMDHLRRTGGKVDSGTDLYKLKSTVTSKVKYHLDKYRRQIEEPLLRHAREILKRTGRSAYELDLYLMAKHAPERDRWMYRRERARRIAEDLDSRLQDRMNVGGLTDAGLLEIAGRVANGAADLDGDLETAVREIERMVEEALRAKHGSALSRRAERAKERGLEAPVDRSKTLEESQLSDLVSEAAERERGRMAKDTAEDMDFSGMTGFREKVGRTPEEYVEEFERSVSEAGMPEGIRDLWSLVNEATEFSLRARMESGLLSRKAYEAVKARGWKHYVPLRSWDEKNPESGDYLDIEYPARVGSEGRVFENLKRAKGRKSLADSPLAYISRDAESTLTVAEKNRYLQAVGRLAEANPVYTYIFSKRAVTGGATGDGYDEKLSKTETGREESSRLVRYKVDGEERVVAFVNPMLAAAVRGDWQEKWNKTWTGNVFKAVRAATRAMSSLSTALNPPFALMNLIRDLGFGFLSRTVEDGGLEGFLFLREWMRCLPMAFHASLDADWVYGGDTKNARYVREWKENGGETGWHTLHDLRGTRERLGKELRRGKLERNALGAARAVGVGLRFFAEVSENSVRLAAFMDARRRGMDVQGAAYYAKEITTNFNRRSRLSEVFGPMYMFFNAQVQGVNRLWRLFRDHPKRFGGAALSMSVLGLLSSVAAALLSGEGDDDDYLERSPYIRYNNFVLGRWTIPLAHGFKMFFGLGASLGAYLMGQTDEEEMFAEMLHIVGNELLSGPLNVTDLLEYDRSGNEVNGSTDYFVNLVPSILTPVAEVGFNRDYMGNPINREPYTRRLEDYVTDVSRYMPGTNPLLVRSTEKWASFKGYDPDLDKEFFFDPDDGKLSEWFDVSASSLEHVMEGYFGGAGAFLNDLVKLGWKIASGEPVDLSDIPVMNKLNRKVNPERAILQDYYRVKEYVDAYVAEREKENKNMEKPFLDDESREEAIRRFVRLSSGEEVLPVESFLAYRDLVEELMEMERQLQAGEGSEEQVKTLRLDVMRHSRETEQKLLESLKKPRALRKRRFETIRDKDLREWAEVLEALEKAHARP